MSRCMECGKEYDRKSGPMISLCDECVNQPPPPPSYVMVNGVLVRATPWNTSSLV